MAIKTRVDLLKRRRTKIIATLGPATSDTYNISRLLDAGVNVFRLNMSHGDHDMHENLLRHIHAAIKSTGINAAIMVDLCGPKIRTGKFEDGKIELKRGRLATVTTRNILGNADLIPSQYRKLHVDVSSGDRILINDGLITLEVIEIKATEIKCKVIHGGIVSDHKGINIPDSNISTPALTAKDRKDAIFALSHDVDYLSLSFVRTANEVKKLRKLIYKEKNNTSIISKIETPQALENIDEILEASDAIMVARGDLGVELRPEEVPVAQLQLIARARGKNRPVIVATQVLESMIENPRPTRAEISDISYAVSSGADALMLSAESSVGKYPIKSVQMMDRAIRHTESHQWQQGTFGSFELELNDLPPLAFGAAISNATSQLSKDLLVRAIVVFSNNGMSAVTVSSARPSAPIIGITSQAFIKRKMELMWGVIPVISPVKDLKNMAELARSTAKKLKLASSGDYILLVQGFHADPAINQPSVSVLQI